jgi:hypothetical protein
VPAPQWASLADDVDRERDFDGLGLQTHPVVARLVAQFAWDHHWSYSGRRRNFEVRDDFEIAGEDRHRFGREAELFHLRLGISHVADFKRCGGPGELQRDQIFVLGFIAIAVIAGEKMQRERRCGDRARFGGELGGRRDAKNVSLRERTQRE